VSAATKQKRIDSYPSCYSCITQLPWTAPSCDPNSPPGSKHCPTGPKTLSGRVKTLPDRAKNTVRLGQNTVRLGLQVSVEHMTSVAHWSCLLQTPSTAEPEHREDSLATGSKHCPTGSKHCLTCPSRSAPPPLSHRPAGDLVQALPGSLPAPRPQTILTHTHTPADLLLAFRPSEHPVLNHTPTFTPTPTHPLLFYSWLSL